MFWVLGLTNGVNFIDGVDGLAAGVCAIAAGSLVHRRSYRKSATWAAAAAAAVCGASLAFLRYNFTPAQDFPGRCRLAAAGLLAGRHRCGRRRQNRRRHHPGAAHAGSGRAGR